MTSQLYDVCDAVEYALDSSTEQSRLLRAGAPVLGAMRAGRLVLPQCEQRGWDGWLETGGTGGEGRERWAESGKNEGHGV